MPPHSAKPPLGDAPRAVLFVVYPDIVLLDLSGPLQVFTHARAPGVRSAPYRTHVASRAGGAVPTNTILHVDSDPLAAWLTPERAASVHTLVIVGGDGVFDAMADPVMVEQVARLVRQAARVCSVCSGALLLAATGVLDGRRAVTHWEDCDALATRFPKVAVEMDPIFVKDGHVWTSAGITAGIDMALAIVREDLGPQAAIDMARSLVTPVIRSGGQSQFSADLTKQLSDIGGQFAPLHAWLTDNMAQRITVDMMAEVCAMSARTFARKYAMTMGVPPARALELMRVDAARDLLGTTGLSMKAIALRTGFGDQERMRRAFHRHLKTAPSTYREQFQV
ncbi:helix-turn-helix domain-containing protein [uncultured Tateyamaria sp.]|uniref:GlxA family transcriptional regulator n=1 Tax=Tateyamaria sp. 1078 TaxID=3417464 RepID=UPI002603FC50|nr:helix-turn-helix domain-containing protein [uncultured Tateyamaria sp.]